MPVLREIKLSWEGRLLDLYGAKKSERNVKFEAHINEGLDKGENNPTPKSNAT